MRNIILIAHNIRSCHNVGSLMRTAEGLGLNKLLLTGYTPYPATRNDSRLPHVATKLGKQISKTSLGAENYLNWAYEQDILTAIDDLIRQRYRIAALEQSATSVPLADYEPSSKIALIIGREVEGIEPEVLDKCDDIVEIPMFGKKESFNVAVAAGMALYALRFN